jgi:hypothetical protein
MNKKQLRKRQQRARAHTTRPREPRLCIFCLSNKNAFTAPEHVLSQALGNTRLILPPGVVCDPCNHGPLSGLDKALVEFPPLQLIRVLWSLQRKKGGYATARFSNGTIIGHPGNNIQVESDHDDFLVESELRDEAKRWIKQERERIIEAATKAADEADEREPEEVST